jgi:hypothetical protein
VLIPVTDVIQVVVTLSHWIVPDSMGDSTALMCPEKINNKNKKVPAWSPLLE